MIKAVGLVAVTPVSPLKESLPSAGRRHLMFHRHLGLCFTVKAKPHEYNEHPETKAYVTDLVYQKST